MEKLKEKYQSEYERHMDTYQTKKEALIKEGLLSDKTMLAGKIELSHEKDIPKFEARMNTTEKRIKMDAIVAEIVKQRLLSEPTLEEWKVRYEVREEVYKNKT